MKRTNGQSLISELGENYEYIRTIVQNSIEIKQLEIIRHLARYISYAVTGLTIFAFAFTSFLLLVASGIVFMYQAIGSLVFSLLIGALIVGVVTLIIYWKRSWIIYKPVEQKVFSDFMDRENE